MSKDCIKKIYGESMNFQLSVFNKIEKGSNQDAILQIITNIFEARLLGTFWHLT